jgi:hypothetical protein
MDGCELRDVGLRAVGCWAAGGCGLLQGRRGGGWGVEREREQFHYNAAEAAG